MNSITASIKTRKDIHFRSIFPFFEFKDIEDGSYKKKILETIPKFKEEMASFDIFKSRKESEGYLRATVLSNLPMSSRTLPINPKSNHTIVIYEGGGGFLANLQPVQEQFLKPWANKTNCTIFQLHHRLCPEFKYPTQTNDVFNMYMQVLLYYKQIQGIKNLKVILMGDSAGGNIAASLMTVLAKMEIEIPIELQLIYPPLVLKETKFSPSRLHGFDDRLLYFSVAKTCFQAYLPEEGDFEFDWMLSPGIAPDEVLAKFPPTTIFIGEKDSLRDDSLNFTYRLHKMGISRSRLVEIQGLYHGFMGFNLPFQLGVPEIDQVHDLIQDHIKQATLSPASPSLK